MSSVLVASRPAANLGDLFREAISEASCKSGILRKQLTKVADSFWSVPTRLEDPVFATTPVHIEDLINAAVPLILDVKESSSAALSAQDSSIQRAFIESNQAKHLGLHLIVQRLELLSQSDIPLAQPSAGRLIDISE
jgi:hypothetical protein